MNALQQIKGRRGLRESLANIGWLSGDRVLRMFGAVVVGTAVARYLGPSQFGLLNYGLAIYALFNTISNLGLDFIVVRDVALHESHEPQILGTSFVLKGVASVLTTVGAIVATRILEPRNTTLIMIVALMSFASIAQALDVIDYYFQARTRSRFTVVPRMTVFAAASIARLAAVFLHASLLAFAWIAALEVFFTEIGLVISYQLARRPLLNWNWKLHRAKALLAEGWPLTMSSLMVTLYMRSDQLLLGKLASLSDVGNYAAAIRLSEIWYAVPMIINASVMPRLLKCRDSNPGQYYARLQRLYECMVLVSVIVTLCTMVAGPLIVRLLYGHAYSSAAGILSIHIWTGVFVFIGSVGLQQYIHERIASTTLQRTMLGAIVNVVLNLLLIPRWGGTGSAIATLIAQSIASYFADAFDSRTHHIFRMKTRAYLRFWMLPRLLLRKETS
jgi:polysaccharide transporter, PST family